MVPTSYTEIELAQFMSDELGSAGADLTLVVETSGSEVIGAFKESVNEVLLAYGTNDISTIDGSTDISKIGKLRAIAKVQAWRLAQATASTLYDFADGTQSLKRSQMFSQINKQLSEAIAEAGQFFPTSGNTVRIGTIRWPQDPYGPFDPRVAGIP